MTPTTTMLLIALGCLVVISNVVTIWRIELLRYAIAARAQGDASMLRALGKYAELTLALQTTIELERPCGDALLLALDFLTFDREEFADAWGTDIGKPEVVERLRALMRKLHPDLESKPNREATK